jgi:hypothetical protein
MQKGAVGGLILVSLASSVALTTFTLVPGIVCTVFTVCLIAALHRPRSYQALPEPEGVHAHLNMLSITIFRSPSETLADRLIVLVNESALSSEMKLDVVNGINRTAAQLIS